MAMQMRLCGSNTIGIFCDIVGEFKFGQLLEILYTEQGYDCKRNQILICFMLHLSVLIKGDCRHFTGCTKTTRKPFGQRSMKLTAELRW
jgi:hypothetical protein